MSSCWEITQSSVCYNISAGCPLQATQEFRRPGPAPPTKWLCDLGQILRLSRLVSSFVNGNDELVIPEALQSANIS